MALKIKKLDSIENNRIVGLIVGESGIGKTSLAGTLEGKTLIASAESGLLCLNKFSKEVKENIDFVEITSIEDLMSFFELINSKEAIEKYDNLFIDSLTEIGEMILAELKKDPKIKDGFALYGKNNEIFTWFVKELRDNSKYNVWFTCLNAFEKDGVELKEIFNFPGSKTKDNLKGWLDLVLKYMIFNDGDNKHRMLVSDIEVSPLAKDRSGLLEAYEPANLGNITKKILGVHNGQN